MGSIWSSHRLQTHTAGRDRFTITPRCAQSIRGSGQGKTHGECGANTKLTLHRDGAALSLDQLFSDGQAQTAARRAIIAYGAVELLKDPRQIFLSDTQALILHRDDYPITYLLVRDLYRSDCVLDGIIQQNQQYLGIISTNRGKVPERDRKLWGCHFGNRRLG